jgi:hypothetical protein
MRVAQLNELESQATSDTAAANRGYVVLYLQRRFDITAAQAEEMNRIGLQMKDALTQQDAQAQEIRTERHIEVQTNRARNLPAPPRSAKLDAMPAQRTALILGARDRLRESLGNDVFAHLDADLKAQFAKQATATGSNSEDDKSDISEEDRVASKNRIAYRAFLHEVMVFKARAIKERSLGLSKTADGYSTEVQRLASLNDEEVRILDEIATDHSNKLDPFMKQGQELTKKYNQRWLALSATSESLSGDKELDDIKDKLKKLSGQIDELIDGAIQNLRERLGEGEFNRFDAFVKQTVKRLPDQSLESGALLQVPKLEVGQ